MARQPSIAVGLNKGFKTTLRAKRVKPSYTKGRLGKRRALAKEVAREVAGFAPYEKRLMELLRNNLDKRALRLAKRKIGAHKRAKRKVDEMNRFARQARAQSFSDEKSGRKQKIFQNNS